jgi:hypothetical protein
MTDLVSEGDQNAVPNTATNRDATNQENPKSNAKSNAATVNPKSNAKSNVATDMVSTTGRGDLNATISINEGTREVRKQYQGKTSSLV